jgi:hypothetical protein
MATIADNKGAGYDTSLFFDYRERDRWRMKPQGRRRHLLPRKCHHLVWPEELLHKHARTPQSFRFHTIVNLDDGYDRHYFAGSNRRDGHARSGRRQRLDSIKRAPGAATMAAPGTRLVSKHRVTRRRRLVRKA